MGSKKDPQRNEVLEKDFRSAHSQLSTLTMALKCPLPCFLFMTGFHLAFQGPAWLLSLPPEFSFLPILSIHSCYQINCHLIPTLTSTLPPSFSLLKPPSCFTPHLVSWFSALIFFSWGVWSVRETKRPKVPCGFCLWMVQGLMGLQESIWGSDLSLLGYMQVK